MWKILLAALLVVPYPASAQIFAPNNTGTSRIQGPFRTVTGNAGTSYNRTTFICVVPDIQNLTNTTQDQVGLNPFTTCDCGIGAAPGCTKSPWCHDNWRATNATILRNMAYEMTGQLHKIAWQFQGPVPARGAFPNPLAPLPRKCDLVVQVGDIGDSGHPHASTVPFANLPTVVKSEWEVAWNNFFQILIDAGVPFIAAHGNHDATMAYKQYFSSTRIQSLPGFYSILPTYSTPEDNAAWAVVAPTPAGNICAITTGCNTDYDDTMQWVLDTVGCGANLPTIHVSHYGIWSGYPGSDLTCNETSSEVDYPLDGSQLTTNGGTATTIVLNAADTISREMVLSANNISVQIDGGPAKACFVTDYDFATKTATIDVTENCDINVVPTDTDDTYRMSFSTPLYGMVRKSDDTFMAAMGHHTVGTAPICNPCAADNVDITNDPDTVFHAALLPRNLSKSGGTVIYIANNWQELDRVGIIGGGAYGAGASDGLGGFYTIVTIEPEHDRISVVPWSTYLQSSIPTPEFQASFGGVVHIPRTFTFDWCTRYLGGAC